MEREGEVRRYLLLRAVAIGGLETATIHQQLANRVEEQDMFYMQPVPDKKHFGFLIAKSDFCDSRKNLHPVRKYLRTGTLHPTAKKRLEPLVGDTSEELPVAGDGVSP